MATTSDLPTVLDLGFTTLYEATKPEIDIVLVHGLGGHPQRTWAAAGQIPIARKPIWKRLRSSKEDEDHEHSKKDSLIYWPAQFLPQDFGNSRIMTFGYNSNVLGIPGFKQVDDNSYHSHEKGLLYSLRDERYECQNRPIIWIAHSLGGILVKEVLLRSLALQGDLDESSVPIQDIYQSTHAVFFFGTPHRGSSAASWGAISQQMARMISLVMPSNGTILQQLKVNSPELERLREQFSVPLKKGHFTVVSFQESSRLPGWNTKVVDDDSSTLDDAETKRPIPGTHVDMCKFESRTSVGYRALCGELKGVLWRIDKASKTRAEAEEQKNQEVLEDDLNECMRSLWFQEMDQRRKLVANAVNRTGTWLSYYILRLHKPSEDDDNLGATMAYEAEYEHIVPHRFGWRVFNDLGSAKYSAWIESGGMLWVVGKAGSGKSTLMKQTIQEAERLSYSRGDIVINFFFNGRGAATEKSPTSLFRTLIHQLLKSSKARLAIWHPCLTEYRLKRDTQATVTWHLEDLKSLFQKVCSCLGAVRVIVFLDAFDEMQEEPRNSASEIMRYFDSLMLKMAREENSMKLCVCFSSRPMSSIEIWWPEHYLTFSMQEQNYDDIRLFVEDTLSSIQKFAGEINLDPIGTQIVARADGVFLWVSLVLQDVLKDIQNTTQSELAQRLRDVPTELSDLYKQLIQRIPIRKKDEALRMFRIALFSQVPLQAYEFRFVTFVVRTPHFATYTDMFEAADVVQSNERMLQRVRACTEGLLEARKDDYDPHTWGAPPDPSHQTVQVLHQSVREFLLSDDGLQIFQVECRNDLEVEAHSYLLRACINILVMAAGTASGGAISQPDINNEHSSTWQLFQYAQQWWKFHAQRSCAKAQAYAMGRFLDRSGQAFEYWKSHTTEPYEDDLLSTVISLKLPECVKHLLEIKFLDGRATEQANERLIDRWIAKLIYNSQDETLDQLLRWRIGTATAGESLNNVLQYTALQGGFDAFCEVLKLGAVLEHQGSLVGTCLNAAIIGSESPLGFKPPIITYILEKAPKLVLVDFNDPLQGMIGPLSIPLENAALCGNWYSFTAVLRVMRELDAHHLIKPQRVLFCSMMHKTIGMMALVLRALGEHLSAAVVLQTAKEAIDSDGDDAKTRDIRGRGQILMQYLELGHSTQPFVLDPPDDALHKAIREKKLDMVEFLLFRYAYDRTHEELQGAHKVASDTDFWSRYVTEVEKLLARHKLFLDWKQIE